MAERRITLVDCGCEALVYADGSGIEIEWCPLHRAAKEMLAFIQSLEDEYSEARQLIAKVTGGKDD